MSSRAESAGGVEKKGKEKERRKRDVLGRLIFTIRRKSENLK